VNGAVKSVRRSPARRRDTGRGAESVPGPREVLRFEPLQQTLNHPQQASDVRGVVAVESTLHRSGGCVSGRGERSMNRRGDLPVSFPMITSNVSPGYDRSAGLSGDLACVFGAGPVGRDRLARVVFETEPSGPITAVGSGGVGTCVSMVRTDGDSFVESWLTARPVRSGRDGALVYAEDGEYLFCAARISELPVYRDAVHRLYSSAFALITRLGYERIFRMWNLVGRITAANAEGMENYRDFVIGRARAFEEWAGRFDTMPAATGIGALSGGIDIYFLATRTGDVVHIENPRQTPAHQYPNQYGPKSPSFARATYLRPADEHASRSLFVSGTASIVGDETVSVGDIKGQCDVTIANLEALVGRANLENHGVDDGFALTDLDAVKVYVRDAEDLPVVAERCGQAFADQAQISYLNADICRPDLLVEIEGICTSRR
jgi:chorismate lyase / 3-hydroxybenzoate synthase